MPRCELHHDFLLVLVDGGNGAQVAIEDLTLVVIDLLDDPVADTQGGASACELSFPWSWWIEDLLQHAVELARPHFTACSRTEHLHLLHRINVVPGQILADQVANAFCSQLWLGCL